MTIVLPILLPMGMGALSLLLWKRPLAQRVLAVVSCAALVGVNAWLLMDVQQVGVRVVQIGNWLAPFGISLVVDVLSALLLLTVAVIALVVTLYGQVGIDEGRVRSGYYPLLHFLLMGVNGALSTGDLFNLYVWFEVLLMASFVLIALGGGRENIEGAVKYVVLNLLASTLFLSGVGLLYNLAGTLNMADLARQLPTLQALNQVTLVAILFLIAFGIKAAAFPLFFWLPASYHTPPVTVTALFSGLLTKVGVYALLRTFTLLFVQDVAFTHTVLLVMAGATMVSGVLGAAAQTDFRRLLSFHIISQIGYPLMGLGLFTQASLAAAIYFLVHVMLAKTALFLVAGMVERLQGTFDLKKLGGLYTRRLDVAVLFLLPALSLAGLPPLSGFFAKLGLVKAGLAQGQGLLVFVSLAVSLMTLYSMTKVWNEAFWKESPAQLMPTRSLSPWLWLPTAALVLLSLWIGLLPGPLFALANRAAELLLHPELYVRAVLGGVP